MKNDTKRDNTPYITNIPDGYEIDQEKTKIVLKELPKKDLESFKGFYTNIYSDIRTISQSVSHHDKSLLPTRALAEGLLEMIQLKTLMHVSQEVAELFVKNFKDKILLAKDWV